MYVKTIRETLTGFPLPIYVCGTSALDLYFGVPGGGVVYAVCEGSLIDAAKSFPDIHYPGLRDADAVIDLEGFTLFLTFVDSLREVPENSVVPLNLLYDPRRRRYLDPYGVYYRLREQVLPVALPPGGMESWYRAGILAQTLSRYHYDPPEMEELPLFGGEELSRDEQRSLLAGILTGRSPDKGLRFLRECGFIDLHWPELAGMDQVDQAKEYHPEGNVWDHSLATFAHRKNPDLRLSLALLLHDIGKAGAEQVDGNRFHKHAQIGSSRAASFLRKMGFTRGMVDDVHFLVKNHMLPAAIHSLPKQRIEETLSSPLFPDLLELYRCDVASSYQGLDNYYKACKVYKQYRKNVRNPYRDTNGKKVSGFLYQSAEG